MDAKKMKGFTLIECLCVLSLASILLIFGAPLGFQWWNTQQAQRDLHQLKYSLQFARLAAISFGHPVTICPSIDQNHCNHDWSLGYVVFSDYNGNGKIDADEHILKTISHHQLKLEYHGFPKDAAITFTALGFSAFHNGHFNYQINHKIHGRLVINQLGQTRIETSSG